MAMAQELVGPGVEVISATYSGDPSSKGIFAATGTSLPMTNGVVLSTGYVTNIAGNASAQASTSTSGGSNDPDLKTLVNNCANCVKDVAYLEFQFKAIGTEINFDFVFGSEEYPEYVCSSYNDVFGFFISGPGITGKKIWHWFPERLYRLLSTPSIAELPVHLALIPYAWPRVMATHHIRNIISITPVVLLSSLMD